MICGLLRAELTSHPETFQPATLRDFRIASVPHPIHKKRPLRYDAQTRDAEASRFTGIAQR